MANEELVSAVKRIIGLSKTNLDEAYLGYRDLFASASFYSYRPEDQRQALKLMILAKGAPHRPTEAMIAAHQAAVPSLTELVSTHHEPGDYEMLGICHVILGNEESASRIFREGLRLERERNAQSDLCGSFMKRISFL
jgi:hypothetical protein